MSTGGIHEAHESVQNLSGKDTSEYRIRAKTVNPGAANEKTVYKVDSKLKQVCVNFLTSIGLKTDSRYVDAHQIGKLLHTKINFNEIQNKDNKNFTLAVISLKKELNTSNHPEVILNKYSPEVQKQVLKDIITLEPPSTTTRETESTTLQKQLYNIDRASPESILENLKEKHKSGINFETGNQDIGQIADRIMHSRNPAQSLDKYDAKVAQELFFKLQGHADFNKAITGATDKPMEVALKAGIDPTTGKKDLGQAASRIMADQENALKFYSEELKKEVLGKIDHVPDVQYVLSLPQTGKSVDDQLKALGQYGINIANGMVENFNRLQDKLSEHSPKTYVEDIDMFKERASLGEFHLEGSMTLQELFTLHDPKST